MFSRFRRALLVSGVALLSPAASFAQTCGGSFVLSTFDVAHFPGGVVVKGMQVLSYDPGEPTPLGAPLSGDFIIRESPRHEPSGLESEVRDAGALSARSDNNLCIEISRDGGSTWCPMPVRRQHGGTLERSDGDSAAPRSAALQACVPNPFNPTTTIAFDLAHEGAVQLRIVDVRGRVLRTLAQGSWPAGRHVLSWNGTDDAGNR